MEKENINFIIELIGFINKIQEKFWKDFKLKMSESDNWKDYYYLKVTLEYCNSKYEDTIVFYSWDRFNWNEFLQELENIFNKWQLLLK